MANDFVCTYSATYVSTFNVHLLKFHCKLFYMEELMENYFLILRFTMLTFRMPMIFT